MSMIKSYDKKMTKGHVKAKERGDVDLERLVKHGAARIPPAAPVYADLTDLPRSRGQAAAQLVELLQQLPAENQEAMAQLLRLKPEDALRYIGSLRPPATKRDDLNNANEAGSSKATPKAPGVPATGSPSPNPEPKA